MATTTTFEKYGVPISLSISKAVSSKSASRKGFAYPLVQILGGTIAGGVINAPSRQGNYVNSSSGKDLIRNNLRQLLLTQKGERVMIPDYGLNLQRFLFEPLDQTLFYLLRVDIVSNLTKYFPIVKVLKLSILSSDVDSDRGQLNIGLTLQLQDESLDIFDIEVSVN